MAPANNRPPAAPSAVDTIHALSSGRPPAAIAIIRLSGSEAGAILSSLAGPLPPPRRARVRNLKDAHGELLDRALILWFPGPDTVTGEDLAELHVHGGRAVVDGVSSALTAAGARPAEPGEFTRRALFNGRLDLDAVEGLADLLAAETDYQRREALRRTDGALGRRLAGWRANLLGIAAQLEAAIDYDGEVDVTDPSENAAELTIQRLADDIGDALCRVSAERLRDGLRVVIVGPPNAGKSALFNAIVGHDAAIVSPIAGTTRDAIERPIALGGIPFVLVDTAGQRETVDEIERIGVGRARQEEEQADIVLDLAGDGAPGRAIAIAAKADLFTPRAGALAVSAIDGTGLSEVIAAILSIGASRLPPEGDVALDRRYRTCLHQISSELTNALSIAEAILRAEHIRRARELLDGLTGNAGLEDMLDALFGRFCLGK